MRRALVVAPPPDRQRQPGLRDQLLIGNRAARLPQHPRDHLGLVGVIPAAQRGDHGLDVHGPRLSRELGRRLALDGAETAAVATSWPHFGYSHRQIP